MSFDWGAWVVNHRKPEIAKRVLAWLEKHDFDEEVWRAADAIVDLVAGEEDQ